MSLISKQELIDELLLIATTKNTLTIKEIYEMIRRQKEWRVYEKD